MKIIKLTLCILCVAMFLMLTVSASNTEQLIYEYTNPEMTIIFDSECNFSETKMNSIADSFAGIHIYENGTPDSINNIICSLIGHNLTTGQVNVITHKVSIWNPRCRLDIYDVTACSRCDYTEEVLVSSRRFSCCPENLPLPEGTNPTE